MKEFKNSLNHTWVDVSYKNEIELKCIPGGIVADGYDTGTSVGRYGCIVGGLGGAGGPTGGFDGGGGIDGGDGGGGMSVTSPEPSHSSVVGSGEGGTVEGEVGGSGTFGGTVGGSVGGRVRGLVSGRVCD